MVDPERTGHFWAEEAWRLIWTTVASSLGTSELRATAPPHGRRSARVDCVTTSGYGTGG